MKAKFRPLPYFRGRIYGFFGWSVGLKTIAMYNEDGRLSFLRGYFYPSSKNPNTYRPAINAALMGSSFCIGIAIERGEYGAAIWVTICVLFLFGVDCYVNWYLPFVKPSKPTDDGKN